MKSCKITEVVFILDKSGSMRGLEKDTVKGYNSFLESQKKEEGDVYISTILFSDQQEKILSHQSLWKTKDMEEKDFHADGCTALLDAIGESLREMDSYLQEKEEKRNVIYVIITDGIENASRRYNYPTIKKEISVRQEEGWKFIFLASNISAIEEASSIGIKAMDAVNFHNDEKGIELNFKAVSKAVRNMRTCSAFCSDWREDVDKDYEERK